MPKAQFPRRLAILLAAAAAFYAVFVARSAFRVEGRTYFTLIDDAMISMRYAQHLAAGRGFVWNVGEAPVQGFTNLGWTLYMALLHLVPFGAGVVSLAVMITSAVILLLNVVLVYRLCIAIDPKAKYAPIMAAAITAFYFPLVFWSLRGMEVGLLVLLADLSVLRCLQIGRDDLMAATVLGLVLAVAILVRMDAVAQVALLVAYTVWACKLSMRTAVVVLAIPALTTLGILAFQHAYFGDWLPNTYYQKVVGASVAERVKNGVLVFSQYALRDLSLMALVSAAGVWLYRKLQNREALLLGGLFLIQCLYSVWVGGDYAEPEVASANRFITQGMPALIVLFSLVVDHALADILRPRRMSIPAPVLSGLVASATLVIMSATPWVNWGVDNAPLLKADIRRVRAGLAIAANTSPAATIAVHAAGQIPYYSDRRTIDLLGLNDPVIAKGPRSTSFYPGHDKWNYDHSIAELQPDLIADNWIRLADYMKGRSDYRKLENGMYVRVDTTLVNIVGLQQDYP